MKRGVRIQLKIVRCVALTSFAALLLGAAQGRSAPQVVAVSQNPLPSGNSSRGAEIYEAKCGACHSLDANRIGPRHHGVFGRKSAGIADFRYSPALEKLNVVWNAKTLDKWLQNPTAMAPGTAMGFQLRDPKERADVIAYLRQESSRR